MLPADKMWLQHVCLRNARCKCKANHLYCTDLCCCGAEEDSCKILPVINMLLNNYFHVDSDIPLALSTRMPYCPILTSEESKIGRFYLVACKR